MSWPRRHADPERALQRVVDWRVTRLREAGFEPDLAEQIARHRGYDLHVLLELVDRGCAPKLAARILAPLDDQERPGADALSPRSGCH